MNYQIKLYLVILKLHKPLLNAINRCPLNKSVQEKTRNPNLKTYMPTLCNNFNESLKLVPEEWKDILYFTN